MCRKYPGPKCGIHLTEERKKLELLTEGILAKVAKAEEDEENARLLVSNLVQQKDASDAALTKARADFAKATKRYERAYNLQRNHESRLRVNAIEYGNTLEGIELLEAKIAQDASLGKDVSKDEQKLAEAKKAYHKQVLAFDKANGTVNFRKPAKAYDDAAIYALKDRIRPIEKKLTELAGELIAANSREEEKSILTKRIELTKKKEALQRSIAHCEATQERIRLGYLPDPLGADRHQKEAAHAIRLEQESYERSDTEGFMSQWAHNSVADKNRLKAEIALNNGKSRFTALFDLNGNYVMAKPVHGKYGWAWGIYADPENPDLFSGFVNESKSKDDAKKAALLLKKGYTLGLIMAPAYVTSHGESLVSVRNIILQDFRRTRRDTIDVLTVNLYTHPVD